MEEWIYMRMDDCALTDPSSCCPGGSGIFMPFYEYEPGEIYFRLPLVLGYFAALIWCFLGVFIVCEYFTTAIEVITSQQGERWIAIEETTDSNKIDQRLVKQRYMVWNDTVANLTLMALGSSAPEILLSCLELIGQRFFAGKLGPSTIVGSAAFNFFMIIAVCTSAIPENEIRAIKLINVYCVTCFFSLFAYLWVLFVLSGNTPDKVDVWEGCATFILFPVFVGLAWLADIGVIAFFPAADADGTPEAVLELTTSGGAQLSVRRSIGGNRASIVPMASEDQTYFVGGDAASKRGSVTANNDHLKLLAVTRAKVLAENPGLAEEHVAKLVQHEIFLQTKRSRAHYRVTASRNLTSGKKVAAPAEIPIFAEKIQTIGEDTPAVVQFYSSQYSVMENEPIVTLQVVRTGEIEEGTVVVNYWTTGGTATMGVDFEETKGTLQFSPGETEKTIDIKIIDDNQWEPDEKFYCHLEVVSAEDVKATIGNIAVTEITIINDDEPGVLTFQHEEYTVLESQPTVEVCVLRKNGSSGVVGCKFQTKDGSAMAGKDYEATEGTIEFKHGECSKIIAVKIIDDQQYERRERFYVVITDPTGGVKLDVTTSGADESCTCDVYIESDDAVANKVEAIADYLSVNKDQFQLGASNWSAQFYSALWCNGSREEQKYSSWTEIFMHVICIPWKLVFALVPPTEFCGGWLCFIASLFMIGIVTALVGDLASLLGCVAGLPDELTAITLVALGTSLPDTLASKTAAVQDEHADDAVGNVTGSNAVNVFLGLGLPFTLGSLYWSSVFADVDNPNNANLVKIWMEKTTKPFGRSGPRVTYKEYYYSAMYPKGGFIYPAGSLSFSVAVYCGCAVVGILLLIWRRRTVGGELGGKRKIVPAVILASLWFCYIGLSAVQLFIS
jgi:solute carrier family 8 (sodium/calcium exchanger)